MVHRQAESKYSNNYFLTVAFLYFFKFLSWIGVEDVLFPLYLVSMAGIFLSTFFTWLIAVRTGDGLRSGARVLIFCVLNPVYYVLFLWVYSACFGMPFIMGILYFGVRMYQTSSLKHRMLNCVAVAVFCVVGYFVRPTSVIPFVALFICMLLFVLERKNLLRWLGCTVVFLSISIVLYIGISGLNHSYFSSVEDKNLPVTMWLLMASHGEGRTNSADHEYMYQFETKEEKSAAALEKTIENYEKMGVSGSLSFLYQKLVITWSHGGIF